ncbi:unnamed protein product [Rodentolepis nana]|uniref:Uncharacterized protein n=1 Tax=Rodentolepis nana TaxID=102285 RepID=A0A3P7VFU3_RODNA|nr:unnamed protein product [Rodentolepis nana]
MELQEFQEIEEIRRYWWRNFSIEEPCEKPVAKSTNAHSLGHEQIGGCFVMCLIGLGASLLISLQEFLYKAYHRSRITKRSFCEEVAREFRFSMACSSTRDFGAESIIPLPPPSSRCAPSSKECRMAALAYAPCLPAADRILASANADAARNGRPTFNNQYSPNIEVIRLTTRMPSTTTPSVTPASVGHSPGEVDKERQFEENVESESSDTLSSPPIYSRPPSMTRESVLPSPLSYHPPIAEMDPQRRAYPSELGYYGSQNDFRVQKFSC